MMKDKTYSFMDIIGESSTNKVSFIELYFNLQSGKDFDDDFW